MSDSRRDAQLERWIGELEHFDRYRDLRIAGSGLGTPGPGQLEIDLKVTAWLRREAAAFHFREMLYGKP